MGERMLITGITGQGGVEICRPLLPMGCRSAAAPTGAGN